MRTSVSNGSFRQKHLRAMVEAGLFIALGFGLSFLKIKVVPYGGSITALSMLPILLIGFRHGLGWGLGAGVVYGILQSWQEGVLAPAGNMGTYFAMMALDYFLAFGVLGLAALFAKRKKGLVFASAVCLLLRYACHVLSGVLLWSSYAWEGWGPVTYSFAYNATYMVPEVILTTIAAYLLYYTALAKFLTKHS
jgi:thiamine transporter